MVLLSVNIYRSPYRLHNLPSRLLQHTGVDCGVWFLCETSGSGKKHTGRLKSEWLLLLQLFPSWTISLWSDPLLPPWGWWQPPIEWWSVSPVLFSGLILFHPFIFELMFSQFQSPGFAGADWSDTLPVTTDLLSFCVFASSQTICCSANREVSLQPLEPGCLPTGTWWINDTKKAKCSVAIATLKSSF